MALYGQDCWSVIFARSKDNVRPSCSLLTSGAKMTSSTRGDGSHVISLPATWFVNKASQSAGKLDSGMRGPYKIVRALPGEWTPDTCSTFFEGDANQTDQGTEGLPCEHEEEAVEDAQQSGEAVLDDNTC